MIYRVIIFVLLFVVSGNAQIRRLVIDDFSGGINQAAPSRVAPNQCYDMVNFDVTVNGALVPRRGFTYVSLAGDSTAGTVITGLVPHNKIGLKHLLIQRGEDTTLWSHVKAGTQDSVLSTLHAAINSARPQTGVSSFYYKGNTYIASQGSEMMVYDGTKMFPARPLGPGQPSAVAIDNTTHTTRLTANYVQYRYSDSADCVPDPDEWHNNLSIPSFPVHVYNGAVLVTNLYPGLDCAVGNPRLRLFRSIDGGPYKMLTYPDVGTTWLLDTLPAGSAGAEPTYPYGYVPRCFSSEDDATPDCVVTQAGPGAIRAASAQNIDQPGYGVNYPDTVSGWTGSYAEVVAYSVVFQDSAGRQSYMAPSFCVILATATSSSEIALTGIPTPLDADTFMVKQKLLLRSFGRACDASNCPGAEGDFDTTASGDSGCRDPGNWYVVDTLPHGTTTFTDSMPCCSIHVPSRLYCPIDPDSIVTFSYHTDSVTSGFPQLSCVDSVISFKPTQIIQRGSQAFAIGDPEHPDRIYYSTFYDAPRNHGPTTWVADKFWEIPSDQGDWFVRLAALGNAIYAFRQHSIVKISGFTYYQYQIQVLSNEVGAMAPQSVAATLGHIYFADYSGIYVTTGGEPRKISTPIDSIWIALDNSPFSDYRRTVIGSVFQDEYWLQTGTSVYGTLIFSEKNGSWRRSDVEYEAIAVFNTDTSTLDFGEPALTIVRGEDSIYQQSTSQELDTWGLNGDTTSDLSYTYLSRLLFDGPEREKVHWVDVHGQGRIDSIRLISYREYSTLIDTGYARPPTGDTVISWGNAQTTPALAEPSRRVRIPIDQITPSYQFKMEVFPTRATYTGNTFVWGITSLVIGWQPWDEGRPR